ncbi:hypothetical protein V5N11_024533 [Cardamine amara subsp. amara]|uniref:PRA1 family protein n=1 Tax=Cardamine amara subsp. amara TaxID=228776 RepID=A0ABD1C0P3_CARAN
MVSFEVFYTFFMQFFVLPNQNREETIDPPIVVPPPSPSPQPRPSSSSPSRLPQRQQSNSLLNVAPAAHPLNLANHVPDPHRMDTLSWTALGYCLAAGLEFNAIFAQVANPINVSSRVQLLSLLLNVALCLLIAANWIFARTHPRMAFVMDRVGSAIVLISSTIAAMPTIPLYVSIGIAVFLIIVYAHQRFSSS